jgi:hypothetical protein
MVKKLFMKRIQFIAAALDIEDDMENLRYNNIVSQRMPMSMEYIRLLLLLFSRFS